VVDEVVEPHHQRGRHQQDEDLPVLDRDAEHHELAGGDHLGKEPRPRAHHVHRGVLEEHRDAEGADEGRQPGGVPQGTVGHALDRDAEGRDQGHRNEEDPGQQGDREAQRESFGDRHRRQHEHGDHRPQHEQVAVREVDQLEDAVHHGVAERDQRVDGSDREAVDQLLRQQLDHDPQLVHVALSPPFVGGARVARRPSP
jgi:hypothetical protein